MPWYVYVALAGGVLAAANTTFVVYLFRCDRRQYCDLVARIKMLEQRVADLDARIEWWHEWYRQVYRWATGRGLNLPPPPEPVEL